MFVCFGCLLGFFISPLTQVWASHSGELVEMETDEEEAEEEETDEEKSDEETDEEVTDNEETGILSEMGEELLEEMELEELQDLLDELLEDDSFNLGDAMKEIFQGKQPFTRDMFLSVVYRAVFGELDRQREILIQILLLILGAVFLNNLANAFHREQISDICFYVVYLLLFGLLVKTFKIMSQDLQEQLTLIVTLMKGVTPAYYLAIAVSNGSATATMFYQIILLLILGVEVVAVNIILPCIHLYVLLELVNHLSSQQLLSRFASLLKTVVEWSLKTFLTVLAGFQVIQSLIAPVMDSLRRTALGKTASAIPGVGGVMNSVTEIILTSAVLIRNSLGVVFLIAFLLWGITPLLQYGTTAFLYKLLAALAQPVCDKRMVNCVATLGEGSLLLLKTLFTVQILCMLTILVLANTFHG
jgi:stage III sporulation protein AE